VKVHRATALLVMCAVPLAACAATSRPAPAAKIDSTPSSSQIVGMRPLGCFPASVAAWVGGVPAAQATTVTPPVASTASPVEATIQLGAEPPNVTLTEVSLRVLPNEPGIGAGSSTVVPSARPSTPPAVKTMAVSSPRVGVPYRMEIDGTSDTPGVAPTPGLYDVEVVQDITVSSSCGSNITAGPPEGFEVTTTIGRVRFA
jgi:hypothetical protein